MSGPKCHSRAGGCVGAEQAVLGWASNRTHLALSSDLALLRMTENSTLSEASGWWALLCEVGEQKGHWAHTLGTMQFRDGRALESSFYPTTLTR